MVMSLKGRRQKFTGEREQDAEADPLYTKR